MRSRKILVLLCVGALFACRSYMEDPYLIMNITGTTDAITYEVPDYGKVITYAEWRKNEVWMWMEFKGAPNLDWLVYGILFEERPIKKIYAHGASTFNGNLSKIVIRPEKTHYLYYYMWID